MGEAGRLGGVSGRCGIGSKDSMPGRRRVCCGWLLGLATGSESVGGGNWEGVTTWFSRLVPLWVSGCQVRRLHASSAALPTESRLDQPEVDTVGDDSKLLWLGEYAPLFGTLRPGGPNTGPRRLPPCGDWNGFPPEGTLNRRPGVLEPVAYMLWDLECDELGDATPEPQRGLPCPVENVADVGVLKSLGDGGR